MMTIAKQRRTEVDRARQFFRKPQSSEEARLDKLHVRDAVNPAFGKTTMIVREKTEEPVAEDPHHSRSQPSYHTRENGVQPRVV